MLYRHLDALASGLVPRRVLVDLWTHYERRTLTNQLMAQELLRVLALFDHAGIAALPYKGPAAVARLSPAV